MNVTAIADPAAELPAEAPRLALLRRILLGRSSTIVATVIVVVFGVIAVFAPLIAPYDPLAQSILSINALPSSEHWLGTDKLGRDVVSRLIYGSRNSLIEPTCSNVVFLFARKAWRTSACCRRFTASVWKKQVWSEHD